MNTHLTMPPFKISHVLTLFRTPAKFHVSKLATTSACQTHKKYKLVVLGGGAGGCATAAKFSARLGPGAVALVDPAQTHYYQPMWTLVGGGIKTLEESGRPMKQVLPKKAVWFQQRVVALSPEENKVILEDETEIGYEFLVVALGLKLNYNAIKGLPEAFETPGVCSNFSSLYVNKTLEALKNFKEGNALFTFPNTPVKCAGAPQKAMYISEEYLRKTGKRDKAKVMFTTAGGVLFGVKKYANSLWKVVSERDISVHLKHELVEVKPDTREAVFRRLDDDAQDQRVTIPYEMIHICPPMGAPDVIRNSKALADSTGFLEIDKETLQHVAFSNIFGVGDCTNAPTSKTAAAAATQVGIVDTNLSLAMKGEKPTAKYDGYTSCPLVTGYSKCILAEFDYSGSPLETFPLNQAVERRSMFHLKRDMMPTLYWHAMLKGRWNGPKMMRKAMHLGFSK